MREFGMLPSGSFSLSANAFLMSFMFWKRRSLTRFFMPFFLYGSMYSFWNHVHIPVLWMFQNENFLVISSSVRCSSSRRRLSLM